MTKPNKEQSPVWKLTDQELLQVLIDRQSDKRVCQVFGRLIRLFEVAAVQHPLQEVGLTAAVGLTKMYGRAFGGDFELVAQAEPAKPTTKAPIRPAPDARRGRPEAKYVKPRTGDKSVNKAQAVREVLSVVSIGTTFYSADIVRMVPVATSADIAMVLHRMIELGTVTKERPGVYRRVA